MPGNESDPDINFFNQLSYNCNVNSIIQLFNKYRPISLLPLFSKVLERLMYDRLYSFLVKYSILYSCQFGFRKAHSTYMALTCMLDKLHNALERGEYAIGLVFLLISAKPLTLLIMVFSCINCIIMESEEQHMIGSVII